MRNIHGIDIPKIGDYIYYRNLSGVLPGRVIQILEEDSTTPQLIILGHLSADIGKHIHMYLSDVKRNPVDWKN